MEFRLCALPLLGGTERVGRIGQPGLFRVDKGSDGHFLPKDL